MKKHYFDLKKNDINIPKPKNHRNLNEKEYQIIDELCSVDKRSEII